MKPGLGYFGSKRATGAFQAIIAAMPAHETYIETHLGGGSVMAEKPPCRRSIGLDLDQEALEAFPLEGVELHNVDCVDFLAGFDYASAGRVFLYVDPPYVLSTRTSSKRYRFDYTDEDHIRLLVALRRLPRGVKVLISGYPNALYDALLTDWRTIEFQVMTRGGVRMEKLWMNYPADSAHWARFAGRNFTERQNIKRKAANWARMYAQMQPGERLAVLAAILAQN